MDAIGASTKYNCTKYLNACTQVGAFCYQLLSVHGNMSFDLTDFFFCFHFLALSQWIGMSLQQRSWQNTKQELWETSM